MAIAIGVACAGPAAAQKAGGKPPPVETPAMKERAKKKAADDAAYRAALEKVPDPKVKSTDPWGTMR